MSLARSVDNCLRQGRVPLAGIGERAEKFAHIGWQRTDKRQGLARDWVLKAQFSRMQGLSLERFQCGLGPDTQPARARFEPRAIDRITQQRMAQMCHMHPNLMRAAGLEREPEQAGLGSPLRREEGLKQLVMRDGVARVWRSCNCNLCAVESTSR